MDPIRIVLAQYPLSSFSLAGMMGFRLIPHVPQGQGNRNIQRKQIKLNLSETFQKSQENHKKFYTDLGVRSNIRGELPFKPETYRSQMENILHKVRNDRLTGWIKEHDKWNICMASTKQICNQLQCNRLASKHNRNRNKS